MKTSIIRTLIKLFILYFFLSGASCTKVPSAGEQLSNLEARTGLHEIKFLDTKGLFLGKTHKGYELMARFEMGEVWGRYTARVIMGESGRELGGVWSFLTGSYANIGSVVGSPLDRMLSRAIGQPVSMFFVLKHNKPNASRLDVLSSFSTVTPQDPLPKFANVGFSAGSIYTADKKFADSILADSALMESLRLFRSQYIRVDQHAVSFTLAGSENEYSGTINNAGGYEKMINSVMDTLALIADKVPK